MKKLFLFTTLFVLFGCSVIEAGKFSDERNSLHERHGYDVCKEKPERCINGVPW